MSEPRTKEVIAREYSNLCTRAGHASYQIETIRNDLKLMYDAMKDLNIEAATLDQKEKESANA